MTHFPVLSLHWHHFPLCGLPLIIYGNSFDIITTEAQPQLYFTDSLHYEYEYGTPTTICTTSDGGGGEEEQYEEEDDDEENEDFEEYGAYTSGAIPQEEPSFAEDKYSSVSNDKFIKEEDDPQGPETVPSSFRTATNLPESEAVDERRTRKELSICGTHFESIYGASGIDTHSVCVQTEASDLEGSMTTPTAAAVEPLLEKVFKEFGTMTSGERETERTEEGHGTASVAFNCVSENMSSNSSPTNIRKEGLSSKIGRWTEAEEEDEYEKRDNEDVFSTEKATLRVDVKEVKGHREKEEEEEERQHCCALIADEQTSPHDDGALPKVHNRDVVVQPTTTHVTDTTTGARTATSLSTGTSVTWHEPEVEEVAAAATPPVALDVWAQRQEEGGVKEGVSRNRNIKYCPGKERASGQPQRLGGKLHESDDIDKNNDNSTGGGGGGGGGRTEGEQYRNCNTCSCSSCQFCRSPRTRMTRTEMTGADAKGERQSTGEKTMSRVGQERKQSDNCTASSCPSSSCFHATTSSATSICCCCSVSSSGCCCCCSTCSASSVCGRSTAAARTATAASEQKSEDSKSPSENSTTTTTTINCPSRRRRVAELTSHRRPPRLTTTKSVVGYNNQLAEKSSRECCERPRRELIKSVRTVPEDEGEEVVLNEKKVATETVRTNTERHSWEIGGSKDAKVEANNCSLGRLESVKGQEMLELDFKNASRTRPIAQSASTMDLDKEAMEECVRRYDKETAERRSNKGNVRDKITKEMEETKLDQEDNEDGEGEADDILDKSTPETVINNDNGNNNRQKARSYDDDELVTRGTSCSDGEEEDEDEDKQDQDEHDGRGGGVLEWARRKKRKVQSQLNEERQRHINVNRQTALQKKKKKHINRASATDDRTRMRGNDVSNSNSKNTNGSWSVTVAGCYHPNMAPPDLQMRLSFPGTRSAVQQAASSSASMDMMNCWNETTTTTSMSVPKLPRPSLPAPKTMYEEEVVPELDLKQARNLSEDDDEPQDEDQEDVRGQVLPVIDLVAKRKSLMRTPLEDCKFDSEKEEMVRNL